MRGVAVSRFSLPGVDTRGLLYTAASGEGTFVRALSAGTDDSRRVFVDHARKPCDTRVLESVEAGHTSHAVAAQVCSDLGITLPPIRVDGQCKYGLLSEGQVRGPQEPCCPFLCVCVSVCLCILFFDVSGHAYQRWRAGFVGCAAAAAAVTLLCLPTCLFPGLKPGTSGRADQPGGWVWCVPARVEGGGGLVMVVPHIPGVLVMPG